MIRIRLREAMRDHERRSAERITYAWLARKTGLSRATLEAIGSRRTYNPSLETIERLCVALAVAPADLLEMKPPGRARRAR